MKFIDIINLDILDIPDTIVFSLIDEVNKRVYVNETSNGLFGTIRLIHEKPQLRDISNSLNIEIIEPDLHIRRHYTSELKDRYAENGYTIVNPKKMYQYVRTKILFEDDVFRLYIVNNRNTKTIVGEFSTYPQAQQFYVDYYKAGIPFPLVVWLD